MSEDHIRQVLLSLSEKGVSLSCERNKLIVQGRIENLDLDSKRYLTDHKSTILAFIRGRQFGALPAIVRFPHEESVPLSYAQQRLWFIDQLEGGSAGYIISGGLRAEGELDVESVRRALDEIVARHEVLRTSIVEQEGRPVQVIKETAGVQFEERDLSGLEEAERERELYRLMGEHARKRFDLSCDVLLRVWIVKLSVRNHAVLFGMHHIASDGWSLGILIKEFTHLYPAYRAGRASELPALKVQYADYAQWQRQWLQGELLDRHLGYWEEQLRGIPQMHSLPLDKLRPAQQGYEGGCITERVDERLSTRIKTACRERDVTLFMFMQAAFALLLSRYSGERDIVMGTPVAGRQHVDVEPLIGFFVNTLVLRTQLDEEECFSELLERSKRMILDAFEHQAVPFEMLVERLQPQRSLSHGPLFQIMFGVQNTEEVQLELPGLRMSGLAGERNVAKFDLDVSVSESDGTLQWSWSYNSGLFEHATIERMMKNFAVLLHSIVEDPQRGLYQLNLLSDQEKRQLRMWNETTEEYPTDVCVHELFEEQVRRNGQSVAVVCGKEQLRYEELNRLSNQLAHYLLEQGIKPDDLVALCVERSPEMMVGLLGILKAGGAYVPIDPTYPSKRIEYLLHDCGAGLVVTQRGLVSGLPLTGQTVVCLEDQALLQRYSQENPGRERTGLQPHHLAYVIYTSGSTGHPKGVMVEHDNVVRLFRATQPEFSFGSQDVWTLFHSFAFDFSVWEIWGALLYGGRLVVVPYWVSRSPAEFYRLLKSERVTVLNQTPSAFAQLIDEDREQEGLPSLRSVIFGGEALNPISLAPWLQRYGEDRPRLVNMYGITETTVHVTYRRLLGRDVEGANRGSAIGSALKDLSLHVLDAELGIVPVGVMGEIYVGGPGVARGYLNQPKLTAERFIDSPFAAGQRLYRTGDWARRRIDGELEYLGRTDQQVKLRGFRIELAEVEAQLMLDDRVSSALVLIQEADEPARHLVAYVVPRSALRDINESACRELAVKLRERLSQTLPGYMVPSILMLIEDIPLTTNGKVDRKALPQNTAGSSGAVFAPAGTDSERTLCEIWKELLKVRRVGIQDNFFSLGGDSIRAIQVVAHARAASLEFSVRDMFTHQTIFALAAAIDSRCTERWATEETARFSLLEEHERQALAELIETKRIQDAYPLSMLQEGMIFHNLLEPTKGLYRDILSARIQIRWDQKSFLDALNAIVAHHESLRTVFKLGVGRPLQLVYDETPIPFEAVDWRDLSHEEQTAGLSSWTFEESQRSFDFSKPMWQIVVHVLSDQEIAYHLICHHALWDGWSVASLNAEIFRFYTTLLKGELLPAATPLPSYSRFIAREQKALQSQAERNFWQARVRMGQLPWWTSKERGDTRSLRITLTESDSAKLLETVSTLGVQERSMLLAVHMVLMALLDGGWNVITSVVFNGRLEHSAGERMLGLFLNSLPFPMPEFDGTWASLLQAVERQLFEFMEHRHFPVAQISHMNGEDYSASLFNFVNFHVYEDIARELDGTPGTGFERINYQLLCTFHRSVLTRQIGATISVDTKVFDAGFLTRIGAYLQRIVRSLLSGMDVRIDLQSLVGPEELGDLLNGMSDTVGSSTRDRYVHGMFEACVESGPGTPAVVDGDVGFSYSEVNARSNQLARWLINRGIAKDRLIGLCIDRTINMVVAVLGILKAGAAYVPIDSELPPARVRTMLANTGLGLVLTRTALAAKLPRDIAELVCLEEIAEELGRQETANLVLDTLGATSAHLAYVLHTSGSTGAPKAVGMPHRALVNLIVGMQDRHTELRNAPTVLQFAPLSFDMSFTDVFLALGASGCLVLTSESDRLDPNRLLEIIAARRVSVLNLPYAMLQSLAEVANYDHRFFPNLQVVISTAEQLRITPEIRRLFRRHPECSLLNHYGPTETHVVTSFTLSGDATNWPLVPPIGRPLPNVCCYVLGRHGGLVPSGVLGELFVGGSGQAIGYLGQPDLTLGRFVPDEFGGAPDARLYKTGDFVRRMSDDNLYFAGRADDQLKVRGFRIEPGEIEAHLCAVSGILESVVLAVEQSAGGKSLVAYVVPADRQALENSVVAADLGHSVRASLCEVLPGYMVPEFVIAIEAIPLSSNGKVDRNALPKPGDAGRGFNQYTAPRNRHERIICGAFARILRVDVVGVHDNFFALGGNSLSAMRLASLIRADLDADVPLGVLFQFPTAAQLADAMEQYVGNTLPAIVRFPHEESVPLSYAQQRLWFIDQLEGGSAGYIISGGLRAEGELDVESVRRALDEIVARHEVLRTSIVEQEGRPVQVIKETAGVQFEERDLSGLEEAERERELYRLMGEHARKRFDLSCDVLLRVWIVKLSVRNHAVLFGMHHIASDGWSLGILIKEFTHLYPAYRAGRASELPALKVQYADYAQWQRQWLQGELLDRHLGYWEEQLRGIPQMHSLPLDKPRPAQQGYEGGCITERVDERLSTRIKTACRERDVTLFMFMQAAFALLLSRYSGERDIVMGTPVAGRQHVDVEPLIGFFVNTLVLRTQLDEEECFSELLERSKRMILDAFEHQAVPFEMLVERLQPQRSLSHGPLFQIMFGVQNTEEVQLELPGLRMSGLAGERNVAKFDLDVSVSESDGTLQWSWSYNSGLFEHATIERMMKNFAVLLHSIVEDPQRGLYQLNLLSDQEKRQLRMWNETTEEYPTDVCVHELFEEQVRRNGQSVAVVCGKEQLRYEELNRLSNQLAHYLLEQGIKPDDLVALCVERSPEMMVGLLGILKAGGAYVPIDPTYPSKRIEYLLHDCGAGLVVTQRGLVSGLPLTGQTVVCLEDQALLQRYSQENPGRERTGLQPHHLAYVIYTSGSTGHPKGVMVEHGPISSHLLAMTAYLSLQPHDRILQVAAFAFDTFIEQAFGALAVGAQVHLAGLARWSVDDLFTYCTDHRITITDLPPAYFAECVDATSEAARFWATTTLTRVVVGGDWLPWRAIRDWNHLCMSERCRLINAYGPTEAVISVAAEEIGPETKSATIGSPLRGRQIYILGDKQELLPVGAVGELCIAGKSLARGYLNRPGLTVTHFLPNPFGPGSLYRSGDAVRYTKTGKLELIGRADDQVKIRGYRVELGEIEAQLTKNASVADSAVIARTDGEGRAQLVAYVVPTETMSEVDPHGLRLIDRLRAQLTDSLPEFMIPTAFVTLETMPLTPNGKKDRTSLPPLAASTLSEDNYVAPRNEIEASLCSIWRDLLGLERVGVHDNFFAIGGDSIISIQAVARARGRGIFFKVRDLFELQSISALASRARLEGDAAAPQEAVVGAMPLLPIQRDFFSQQLPAVSYFNQSVLLQTPAGFKLSALSPIVESIYRRHDALLLRFHHINNDWIAEHCPYNETILAQTLHSEDLSALPLSARLERLKDGCERLQESLEITWGPLLRVGWFDLGDLGGRLFVVIHHLVVDGVSWRILLADLERAYVQKQALMPIELAPKTGSFKQWAQALHLYATTAAARREVVYWLDRLRHVPTMLPGEVGLAPCGGSERAEATMRLNNEDTTALLAECNRAYRTRTEELLLAGLFRAYQSWTGKTVMRVSIEGHGREGLVDGIDVTETVGWFTAVYPLTLICEGTVDPGEHVKQVKEQMRVIPNNGVGFGVLRWLAEDPELVRACEGEYEREMVFNYLGQLDNSLGADRMFPLAKEPHGAASSRNQQVRELISINGLIIDGELAFTMRFDRARIDSGNVTEFAAHFQSSMLEILTACRDRLKDLALLEALVKVAARPEQAQSAIDI